MFFYFYKDKAIFWNRESIRDFHDRMFDVFQKMPPKLMLIMRNLNTIRSIIKVNWKLENDNDEVQRIWNRHI